MTRLDTATRQKQIKRAVLDIISTEGMRKLSTRNLASRIGVTEGALFRHFSSKKDIMHSIIEDVNRDLLAEQKRIAYSEQPANEKLKQFLCFHVNYLIANKGISMFLFSEAAYLNESTLKTALRAILLKQKEYVSDILRQGIREGAWDASLPVESVVMMYMGIPITFSIEMILQTERNGQEEFCAKMLSLLSKVLEKR